MRNRLGVGLLVIATSVTAWTAAMVLVVGSAATAAPLAVALFTGPAWAYAFCLASADDDFPEDASRGRGEWLRVLPLTFVLAPLLLPSMALLVQFFRDSRADHGQTWLGYGRSRPGEGREDER